MGTAGTVAGGAFWLALAFARAEAFVRRGDPLFLLAALPAALATFRLVFREPAQAEAPAGQRLAAWAGALLPMAMHGEGRPSPLAAAAGALGLALALWALWTLGGAFGIAPAHRGRIVTGGPYRFLRHPAYAGELLSVLAFAAAHPSPINVLVAAALVLLAVLRIRWEEALLGADPAYAAYKERVRWRMLPFIW